MDKILITVHISYTGKDYDFFVPINVNTKEVFDLIQKAVHDADNNYVIKDEIYIFDSAGGQLINQNNIIKFSGLRNGSHVLLH